MAVRRHRPPAGEAAAVHRRLPGRPGEGRLRLPGDDAEEDRSTSWVDEGGAAVDLVKAFKWTNDDQNVVAKYISEDGMTPEDAAAKWIGENQDKVDAWLG